MVEVTVDDVRDILNVDDTVIPDVKVTKFLQRAEVACELETGSETDYADCTKTEAHFIKHLAAIHGVCWLTGGRAIGMNFSLGDMNVSVMQKIPSIEILKAEVDRALQELKGTILG